MDDGEIVAALAAGDPGGVAAAYDRYAGPLYGYCRWMLRDPEQAASALRETFATAARPAGGLKDADQLRACLYGIARDQCSRRLRTAAPGFDEIADGAYGAYGAYGDGQPAEAGQSAEAGQTAALAEVRRLIRETLAELRPDEREVIELSIRHNLSEDELAYVLNVSWSRAYALATQARQHLEKALDALLIAYTGRESCRELAALLADWDGRLTVRIGRLTARHLDLCETCTAHRHGAMRPEVLSRMLPLDELPPGLREPVPEQADDSAVVTAADRPTSRPTRMPEPTGLRRILGFLSWSRIRANPGRATAIAAVTVWVVAAMSATMVTLASAHTVRPVATQGQVTPADPVIPAGSNTALVHPHTSRKPRPHVRHRPALQPTAKPVSSALPTLSAEPTASKSASPSPSSSASASSSPTPTRSHTPTPTPTSTPPA
ncbi:MAG TPA: sigma-70 family RNA polymerase sigma factor [Streptosporangiaceae bacterium]|jgi:RNA polymerase sigma factor (sigma-70 family)